MSEIHKTYLCPVEYISCPGCGKIYRGKVCVTCEECKTCCSCEKPILLPAVKVKEYISTHGEFPKPEEIATD